MRPPHIELICIGTELLTGKVNTHAAYIGEKLFDLGLSLNYEHTVGDDKKLMLSLFKEAWERSDILFSAGGLGPTFDDISRECWSDIVRRPLKSQPKIIADIEDKFRKRGIFMPPQNKRQGDVLQGADVISNEFGTAPGQFFSVGKKCLILLPGPARELYPMMESYVMPRLKKKYSSQFSQQKVFLIFGIAESKIDEIIRPTVEKYTTIDGCAITHGILASQAIISVKFRVEGNKASTVKNATHFLTKTFRTLLSGYIFGEDDDTLPAVIGRQLKLKKNILSVAESCTGGLLAKMITDVPGSSDYFLEGITTYSNISKHRRLGVQNSILKKYGAVSEEVAVQMAVGMKKSSKADFALSVTGIAGPEGGTAQKPVGLVYIGCATPLKTMAKKFVFKGARDVIRSRAALTALHWLHAELKDA